MLNQNYCFQVTNDVKLLEMMQWLNIYPMRVKEDPNSLFLDYN